MSSSASQLDPDHLDVERFRRDGFVVCRGLLSADEVGALRRTAESHLQPLLAPVEYEADVNYPGAPATRSDLGGETPRRLLNAMSRDGLFRAWATDRRLGRVLARLMGAPPLVSQCHHNCVMTKHPGFSSATGWHQDIRYWSFDAPELVSVWLALGEEHSGNGGLLVMPGSHALQIDRGRLDAELFLRADLEENRALVDSAVSVDLMAGDALLFHCNLFHAAGANRSDAVKLSLVFTYHALDNRPIPGTRSANYPSLPVDYAVTG